MSSLMRILSLLVVSLVVLSASAKNEKTDQCLKLKDSQVRDLFNRWNKALKTLNADTVVKEYWDESILLPTLSNVPRSNKAEKLEYFHEFLLKKPVGKIVEDYIYSSCNIAQYR